MEFVFHLSDYDSPALEDETVRLLTRRLEAHSRRTMPGVWKATDKCNAYAAKGPGREKRRTRYRIYGVILIALGIFALVPGLAEPQTPVLTGAGVFAILSGILNFRLTGERKAPSPPDACRKEAARLLEQRRSIDWSLPENRTELRFDREGMSVHTGEETSAVPYADMTGLFETENLWMLLYGGEQAVLLQRKDLTEGSAEDFSLFIREKLTKRE